jgi:1-aminocyclopropane-1-carboxylate synthase
MRTELVYGAVASAILLRAWQRKPTASAKAAGEQLSARGQHATAQPVSYFSDFFASLNNLYDPATNPHGKIVLAVAENNISFDLLRPRLRKHAAVLLPMSLSRYDNMKGSAAFRTELARLLTDGAGFGRYPFRPDGISVSAGCGAVLDALIFCLCDPGDAVLIPSPYYPAFDNDLVVKAGVVPVPVPTAAPRYEATPRLLDAALARCRAGGRRARILLLTNPHNPLGTTMPAEAVRQLVSWARRNEIHLISDEVYAFSAHSPAGGAPFASVASVTEQLGDWVHVVYGFSKDFCMSGFRVGLCYTENRAVHAALDNISYFCAVSNHTQHALTRLLAPDDDEGFVQRFIDANAARLRQAYEALAAALAAARLPHIAPCAGLFAMVDMRTLLDAPGSWAAEARLFKELLACGVLMTPGADCHMDEPGWFRCCFAWVEVAHLRTAFAKIDAWPPFRARRGMHSG